MKILPIQKQYLQGTIKAWNQVVEDGEAFPQDKPLTPGEAEQFFAQQSFTGVAVDDDNRVLGVYILHPNNVGRCGHICNASYAVAKTARHQGVGRAMVTHCMQQAKQLGFDILQFNAVVADNTPALNLYRQLGFVQLGVIPGGFLAKDGSYKDIIPHYHLL